MKRPFTRSARLYKGGGFVVFKQVIGEHYKLDEVGVDDKDAKNYVNVIEMLAGKQMHILDERHTSRPSIERARSKNWYAFESLWRGPNGDPLFFSQYLSAMKCLYDKLFNN